MVLGRRLLGRRRGTTVDGGQTPGSGETADNTAWQESGWWWCFEHQRAESPPDAPGHRRLGPYQTAADAERWRERLDGRNDDWDEADRRWAGD